MTDGWIMPRYKKLIGEYINNNLKPGDKIAWLGQQQENKYSTMFEKIKLDINIENLEHHFYDILNEDDPPINNRWDIHSDWEGKIKDYDLVLGIRIAYLVQSASGLIENLKNAVKNNKRIMFDFNTGNLFEAENNKLGQRWSPGSTNLIPHFPTRFPRELQYHVVKEDNLLLEEDLERSGMKFGLGWTMGPDPVKNRFYVLAEIIEK